MENTKPAAAETFDEKAFEREYREKEAAAKAFAAKHGIALKGIKIFLPGSEETTCFTAQLTQHGKVIGYAKNDGQGGNTLVHIQPEFKLEGFDDETFVDAVIHEETTRKETARVLASVRRTAKKRGHGALAYKWQGAELSSVSGPTLPGLLEWLKKNGKEGYTTEAVDIAKVSTSK